jgi:hypothetical protein
VILVLLNQGLSLASALVLVFALGYVAVHHQRIFLALFMLLTAFENTRDFAPSLVTTLAGFSIHPDDLIAFVGLGAALIRIGKLRLRSVTCTAALLVYASFVALGVISWISTYGIQLGVNFWRAEILTVALLAYTTTRPRVWSWNDLRIIIVAPAFVVALASVAGILLHGLGSNSSVVEVGGVMEGGRPISASGSLMMLIALWVAVLSAGKWSATRVLTVLLFGGMVLLTQNRSVWVAAIIGVVVWWLAPRIRHRGSSSSMGGLSRSVVALLVASATALVGASLATLGTSAHDDVTWLWRVARWTDSMGIPRSLVQWLMGSSLGPTPASAPSLFPTAAHSLYVNAIEIGGFIGLMAILWLVIAVGRSHVSPSIEPLGFVVCITFLSFGVAYQLPPWAWMVAGVLLASNQIEPSGGWQDLTCDTTSDRIGPATSGEYLVDRALL